MKKLTVTNTSDEALEITMFRTNFCLKINPGDTVSINAKTDIECEAFKDAIKSASPVKLDLTVEDADDSNEPGKPDTPNTPDPKPSVVPEYDESTGLFFCNGVPVVIDLNEDKSKLIASYKGGEIELPLIKGNKKSNLMVFGGSKNKSVDSTNLTVKAGKYASLYAGGYGQIDQDVSADVGSAQLTVDGPVSTACAFGGGDGKSIVGNTTLNLKSFTAISSGVNGAGASFSQIDKKDVGTKDNPENSFNRVDKVTLNMDSGSLTLLYGGPNGYGYAKDVTLNINGGTIQYLIGGGSNGRTDKETINIGEGVSADYAYTANRGFIGDATINSKGTIKKMYAGTSGTSDETAVVEGSVEINILAGTVESLEPGASNSNPIDTSKITVKTKSGLVSNESNLSELFTNVTIE